MVAGRQSDLVRLAQRQRHFYVVYDARRFQREEDVRVRASGVHRPAVTGWKMDRLSIQANRYEQCVYSRSGRRRDETADLRRGVRRLPIMVPGRAMAGCAT